MKETAVSQLFLKDYYVLRRFALVLVLFEAPFDTLLYSHRRQCEQSLGSEHTLCVRNVRSPSRAFPRRLLQAGSRQTTRPPWPH